MTALPVEKSATELFEGFLGQQWFVAATVLFFFFAFALLVFIVFSKFNTMVKQNQVRQDERDKAAQARQDSRDAALNDMNKDWQKRLDDRDKEWFTRLDKRDEEQAKITHEYYNATGANTMAVQGLGNTMVPAMNGIIDEVRDVGNVLREKLGQKP